MPVPSRSSNFGDLLDPRMKDVFNDAYAQLPDRIGTFYDVVGPGPTTADIRYSEVGAFGDVPEFTGSVTYDDVSQGYDVTITPKEYASGFQVERKLYDDDLTGIIEQKPRGLGTAYQRTRQKHAASLFVNSFSLDATWLSHTEGVALCSDSHTTTSGASTAAGFDNLSTASLNAVTVSASRTSMRGFRGDRAERISVMPDLLVVPIDREDDANEIVKSQGKPDTATNNMNVNYGRFRVESWEYLTDANDFWMIDSAMMKQFVKWFERTGSEFAMVENLDTILAKWRLYCRYGLGWIGWRWVLGHQVS